MAAFASAITGRTVMGNKRVHWGTFASSGGATGGNINTGLKSCEFIELVPKTTAPAEQCAVAETLPCVGTAVTIATTANVEGYWKAQGEGSG